MFNLSRTPFSSMTRFLYQYMVACQREDHILCETVWISVVALTGSSGRRRPLVSMRCDAKMVLINVDLPSPVCPAHFVRQLHL